MGWVKKTKSISGNFLVDGTITSDHIKTDSITANKFTGATEEEYFNYFDDTTVGYNTYVTLHEFDFPSTELDLVKGRHIKTEWNGYIYTGQTGEANGSVYLYTEILVPNAPSYRGIGTGYHHSFPVSGWQRVYFKGNLVNRIGSSGSIGGLSTYRAFRNLRFKQNEELTELVSNGSFSGITGWTGVGGSLSSFYGSAAAITQDANTDDAYFYQAVTVEVGKKYRFSGTVYSSTGNAPTKFHISTSTSLSDAIVSSSQYGAGSGTNVYTTDFVATTTTVYVIGEADTTTANQYAVFDNFSLKELEERTYIDISTSGGQVVPTSGNAYLYHHPFGSASAGTWAVVDERRLNMRTTPYSHYFQITSEVYLGAENVTYECRIRARHFTASGDTIYTQPSKVLMQSRMIGEQN